MAIPDSIRNCKDVLKEMPETFTYSGWADDIKVLEQTCNNGHRIVAVELAKVMSMKQRAHARQKFVSDTDKGKDQKRKSADAVLLKADSSLMSMAGDVASPSSASGERGSAKATSRRSTNSGLKGSKKALKKSLAADVLNDIVDTTASKPTCEEITIDAALHQEASNSSGKQRGDTDAAHSSSKGQSSNFSKQERCDLSRIRRRRLSRDTPLPDSGSEKNDKASVNDGDNNDAKDVKSKRKSDFKLPERFSLRQSRSKSARSLTVTPDSGSQKNDKTSVKNGGAQNDAPTDVKSKRKSEIKLPERSRFRDSRSKSARSLTLSPKSINSDNRASVKIGADKNDADVKSKRKSESKLPERSRFRDSRSRSARSLTLSPKSMNSDNKAGVKNGADKNDAPTDVKSKRKSELKLPERSRFRDSRSRSSRSLTVSSKTTKSDAQKNDKAGVNDDTADAKSKRKSEIKCTERSRFRDSRSKSARDLTQTTSEPKTNNSGDKRTSKRKTTEVDTSKSSSSVPKKINDDDIIGNSSVGLNLPDASELGYEPAAPVRTSLDCQEQPLVDASETISRRSANNDEHNNDEKTKTRRSRRRSMSAGPEFRCRDNPDKIDKEKVYDRLRSLESVKRKSGTNSFKEKEKEKVKDDPKKSASESTTKSSSLPDPSELGYEWAVHTSSSQDSKRLDCKKLPNASELGYEYNNDEVVPTTGKSSELDRDSAPKIPTRRSRRRSMSAGPEFRCRDNPDKVDKVKVMNGLQRHESEKKKTGNNNNNNRGRSRRRSMSAGPEYRSKDDPDKIDKEKIKNANANNIQELGNSSSFEFNKEGVALTQESLGYDPEPFFAEFGSPSNAVDSNLGSEVDKRPSKGRRSRRRSMSAGPEFRSREDPDKIDKEKVKDHLRRQESTKSQGSTKIQDSTRIKSGSTNRGRSRRRSMSAGPEYRCKDDPEKIDKEKIKLAKEEKKNQADVSALRKAASEDNKAEALTPESLGYDPEPFFAEFGAPDFGDHKGYKVSTNSSGEKQSKTRRSRRRSMSAGPEFRSRDDPDKIDKKKVKDCLRSQDSAKSLDRIKNQESVIRKSGTSRGRSRRRSMSAGPEYRSNDDPDKIDKEKVKDAEKKKNEADVSALGNASPEFNKKGVALTQESLGYDPEPFFAEFGSPSNANNELGYEEAPTNSGEVDKKKAPKARRSRRRSMSAGPEFRSRDDPDKIDKEKVKDRLRRQESTKSQDSTKRKSESTSRGRSRRRSMSAGPEYRSKDDPDKIDKEKVKDAKDKKKEKNQADIHALGNASFQCNKEAPTQESLGYDPEPFFSEFGSPYADNELGHESSPTSKNGMSSEADNKKPHKARRSRRRSMSAGPEFRSHDDPDRIDKEKVKDRLRRQDSTKGQDSTKRKSESTSRGRSRRRSTSAGPEYRSKDDPDKIDKEKIKQKEKEKKNQVDVCALGNSAREFNKEAITKESLGYDPEPFFAEFGPPKEMGHDTSKNGVADKRPSKGRRSRRRSMSAGPEFRSRDDPEKIDIQKVKDRLQESMKSIGSTKSQTSTKSRGKSQESTRSSDGSKRKSGTRRSRRRSMSAGPEFRSKDDPDKIDKEKIKQAEENQAAFLALGNSSTSKFTTQALLSLGYDPSSFLTDIDSQDATKEGAKMKSGTRRSRRRSMSAGPEFRCKDDPDKIDKEKVNKVSQQNERNLDDQSGRGGQSRSSERGKKTRGRSKLKETLQSDTSSTCSTSEFSLSSGGSVGSLNANKRYSKRNGQSDNKSDAKHDISRERDMVGYEKTREKKEVSDSCNDKADHKKKKKRSSRQEIGGDKREETQDTTDDEGSKNKAEHKKSENRSDKKVRIDENALIIELDAEEKTASFKSEKKAEKKAKKEKTKPSAKQEKAPEGDNMEAFFSSMTTRLEKVDEANQTESFFSAIERSENGAINSLNANAETYFVNPNSEEEFESAVSRAIALQSISTNGGGGYNFSMNIRHLFQQQEERNKEDE